MNYFLQKIFIFKMEEGNVPLLLLQTLLSSVWIVLFVLYNTPFYNK
jgi:hypothetical protein